MEYYKFTKKIDPDTPSIVNEKSHYDKYVKLFLIEYFLLNKIKQKYDIFYFGDNKCYHLNLLLFTLKNPPENLFIINNKNVIMEKLENVQILGDINLEDIKKKSNNKIVIITKNKNIDNIIKKINPSNIIISYDNIFVENRLFDINKLYIPLFGKANSEELYYFYELNNTSEKNKIEENTTITYYNRYLRNDMQSFHEIYKDFDLYTIYSNILNNKNK